MGDILFLFISLNLSTHDSALCKCLNTNEMKPITKGKEKKYVPAI